MLPAFVGEVFGRKVRLIHTGYGVEPFKRTGQIFSTGKSLNFIRYTCHDSDWVATQERLSTSGGSKSSSATRQIYETNGGQPCNILI